MLTAVKAIIVMVVIVSLIGSGLVIFVECNYEGKNIQKAGNPVAPDSFRQWNVSQWENWASSMYSDHPEVRQYLPYWFIQIMQNKSG